MDFDFNISRIYRREFSNPADVETFINSVQVIEKRISSATLRLRLHQCSENPLADLGDGQRVVYSQGSQCDGSRGITASSPYPGPHWAGMPSRSHHRGGLHPLATHLADAQQYE